jgi:hypothetical protein
LLTAEIATVLSSFWPWIFTVAFPAFSSTLTTVASLDEPLSVTFTLSPALSVVEAAGLAAGLDAGDEVVAGAAGLVAAGLFSLLLFAFSVLDSQAVKASARNATAKTFIVRIVLRRYASLRSVVQVSPVNDENLRNVS